VIFVRQRKRDKETGRQAETERRRQIDIQYSKRPTERKRETIHKCFKWLTMKPSRSYEKINQINNEE